MSTPKYHQTPFNPKMGGFVGDATNDQIAQSAKDNDAAFAAARLEYAKGELVIQEAREKAEAELRKANRAAQEAQEVIDRQKAAERWERRQESQRKAEQKRARADAALDTALVSAEYTAQQLKGMVTKLLANHAPVDPAKLAYLRQRVEEILSSLK